MWIFQLPLCAFCSSLISFLNLPCGLVALFSEDYNSSVSYYTGPSKYNLSDPCRQRTTSTSLNFQTS